MAAALPFIGAGMSVAGTAMSANAQNQSAAALKLQAQRKQAEANFEADQLDQDAGQTKAVAQRAAEDQGLQTRLLNSTAIARAAASGAGASDPTVQKVMSRISQMGAYRQGVALYEGEAQARADRLKAAALRYSGDIGIADATTASSIMKQGATATLLAGGAKTSSLMDKYFRKPETPVTPPPSGSPNNPADLDIGDFGGADVGGVSEGAPY